MPIKVTVSGIETSLSNSQFWNIRVGTLVAPSANEAFFILLPLNAYPASVSVDGRATSVIAVFVKAFSPRKVSPS